MFFRNIIIKSFGSALILTGSAAYADGQESPWEAVEVPSQKYTIQVQGVERDIYPGCAMPGDDYSFYYKEGKSDKSCTTRIAGGMK
jgi:hypothetical protein